MKRLLLALTLAAISSPVSAGVIFTHPRSFPDGFLVISENATENDGAVQIAYSSFTLTEAATIDGVSWAGGYLNGRPQNQTQAINGFSIAFFADDAGSFGAILQDATINGNANETAAGTDSSGNLNFTYNAGLSTSFSAAAGTRYWISILALVTDTTPNWGWRSSGTGADGYYITRQPFNNNTVLSGPGNLAFSLQGNVAVGAAPVPEPSTFAMAATPLVGWIACRRKRLRTA